MSASRKTIVQVRYLSRWERSASLTRPFLGHGIFSSRRVGRLVGGPLCVGRDHVAPLFLDLQTLAKEESLPTDTVSPDGVNNRLPGFHFTFCQVEAHRHRRRRSHLPRDRQTLRHSGRDSQPQDADQDVGQGHSTFLLLHCVPHFF